MPTYTYRCKECEHEFDKRQSFSDDALTHCPNCGTENGLRKVVNSVGIVFKGSGFYVTDNSNGKGKVNLPSNTKDEKESTNSNDSSDTKPAKTENQNGSNGSSEKSSAPKEQKAAP